MDFLPDRSKVVMRHILEQHAAQFPEKECILFEDGEVWTYGRALQEAYRAANALAELGVERGDHVLIFMPNCKEWLRAWWGVIFLGAVMIPVNMAYKGKMLRHVCRDSGARHIITKPDTAERVQALNLELEIVDPSLLEKGADHAPELASSIEPWDAHSIMYTSGTTGPSKGVIITYFHNYSEAAGVWFPKMRPEDTMLVDHPLFHKGGLNTAYPTLMAGARIALRTVFSGSRYWDVVREVNATCALMIGTIPSFMEATAPKPDDADNPLRIVFPAPMVRDPKAFMERFGLEELFTGLGMTELPVPLINHDPEGTPGSCGRAQDGMEVRLVDEHDIPVPVGEKGELIVRTHLPWQISGYWGRPEETARAWRNGWFHTGDLFFYDEAGNFYFADRKKDAIRRRGENVSSFEVEREVFAHPEVLEAACVGVPGEYGEQEVKIFVVSRDKATFDPAGLIRFLIPKMPYFMVPRYVEVIPELPKTPTMRVKKYELRQRGGSGDTWDREAAGIEVKRD